MNRTSVKRKQQLTSHFNRFGHGRVVAQGGVRLAAVRAFLAVRAGRRSEVDRRQETELLFELLAFG